MPRGLPRGRLVAWGAALATALLCIIGGARRQTQAEQRGGRQQLSQLWQLWQGGELGGGLDDRVRRGVVDVGGRAVLPHAPSGRLPGYGGGSTFLRDLEPAAGARAPRGASPGGRAAHGADWQRVDIVHPAGQSLAQAAAPAADVPDMNTVIGAYKEVAKLVKRAGDHHDISRRSGEAAAQALERAADSLDSISATLKSAQPSPARLSEIAKSLSGIKSELGSGQTVEGPPQLESVGDAVHRHAARLLGSHFAALIANNASQTLMNNASSGNTTDAGGENAPEFHNSFWDDFETNKDGTIKLNDAEKRIERHIWRRLFGDRFSHGFCEAHHGRAHCLARKEGRWNYDAQTYKLVDPYLEEENPLLAAEKAAAQDPSGLPEGT